MVLVVFPAEQILLTTCQVAIWFMFQFLELLTLKPSWLEVSGADNGQLPWYGA